MKEAAVWSLIWVAVSFVFVGWLWWYLGGTGTDAAARAVANTKSLEFITGYLVEKALAVDNIFVFLMVFTYFAVPPEFQKRVLMIGILGALVLRAVMILIGAWLIAQFHWILYVFGAFLVFTGAKLLFPHEQKKDLSTNPVLRVMRRVMPVTKDFHEQRFLVKIGGVRHATPLLVALLVVEFTDILFALDSVPAIFAVTREPLIVFTSNIFAILGLRALYFLLAGAMDTFHLLHYGLGVVLMFVGVKLVLPIFGMHVPIGISLSVICGVIGASIALSLLFPKKPHAA